MRRLIPTLFIAALVAVPSFGADTKVSADTNASVLDGTEEFHCVQSANDRACSVEQVRTWVTTGLNTEAELEAQIADMANIIQATEIDTAAELDTLVADENLIVETEMDTESELEALLTDMANILQEDEIDASSELLAIMDDETGTGLLVFGTAPTITNAVLAGLFETSVSAGLTASTNQTQGQGALTNHINEFSTVANDGDAATLPTAVKGTPVIVINNGEEKLQIFPASGDDLGNGVDASATLDHLEVISFVALDATNWNVAATTGAAHGQADDEDNTDAFTINDSGGDFHSYHSNGLVAGDLQNWTFDAGGAGTSFPIASVADSAGSPGSQILVTTTGSHGLAAGAIISQTNLSDSAYTGVFKVVSTAAATTYEVAAVFTATGTGTMDEAATLICGAVVAGTYRISWYASATSATNNETFDFQLAKEASVIRGTKVRRKFGTATDFGSFSGGAIADLDAGDKISLAVSNQDTAGNLTIRNLVVIVTRL